MLVFADEPTARPAGEAWDEIERRLRDRLEEDGHETPEATAADVCFSIWRIGRGWLEGLSDPARRDREGTQAEWIKAAKRLEYLAGEMRKCLNGYVPAMLSIYLQRKLNPHEPQRDEEGRIILGRSKAPPDVAELLALFEGFAEFVQDGRTVGPGAPGDPMAKMRRRNFVVQLALLFQGHGLPIGTAEGAFMPRIARLAYVAFGVKADARDDIRAMLAPTTAEQPEPAPDLPSAAAGPESPSSSARGWWGGELPE